MCWFNNLLRMCGSSVGENSDLYGHRPMSPSDGRKVNNKEPIDPRATSNRLFKSDALPAEV
jgi:hypothetical protein